MARTVVIKPDGTRGSVPDENLELAKSKGYKVVTNAEDHPIQAALEGGLRGLTSGLSDMGLDETGREASKQLREQNPIASAGGEIAGVVGQTALVPELGVGRLATAGRIVAEGTLAGIGPQISEAALNNKPLNTEILAADTLASIAVNGITHGAVRLGSKLASNVAGKAGELAASDAVKGAAESLQEKVMKKTLDIDDATYKYAKANGLLSATSHSGVAELAGESARKAGGLAVEQLDEAIKVAPHLESLRNKWLELADTPGKVARKQMAAIEADVASSMKAMQPVLPDTVAKVVPGARAAAVESVVDDAAKAPPSVRAETPSSPLTRDIPTRRDGSFGRGFSEPTPAKGTVNQRGGAVAEAAVEGTPVVAPKASSDTAIAARKQFDDMLARGREGRADTHVSPGAPPVREARASPLTQPVPLRNGLPGNMEKEFVPQAVRPKAVNYEAIAKKFSKFADDYRLAKDLHVAASDAGARHAGMGIVDGHVVQGVGAAAIFGHPVAAASFGVGAMAKNAVRNFAKNKGGYLVSNALGKMAEGEVLPAVFKNFQKGIEGILATAPGVLGPFAAVLGHAASQGTDAFMAVHTSLAKSEQGGDYLARLGLRHETAEEVAAYGQKLAMLEAVDSKRKRFESDLDKHTSAFFRGSSFEHTPPEPLVDRKNFEGHVKGLEQLLRDPQTLTPHLNSDVLSGAPGLAANTGTYAMAAAQFLVDRAPKAPDAWKPKSLRAPFQPSDADLTKWNRYVTAVSNPKEMAKEMAGGKATPETIEAVQTLYPNLFAAIQQRVITQLMALEKPLPYEKKITLANIFGQQILGTTPQTQMYLQSVHQAAAQQGSQQQGGAPAPPSNDGRQMVDSNKNLQTQTQRLEGR